MSFSCDEQADFYRETHRKARKYHKCSACDESISPGHTYWVIAIGGDGGVDSLKRCERCQAIHKHLRAVFRDWYQNWPDERLACGHLYEDNIGPCPPDIAELAFISPEKMQARAHTQHKD